MNPRRLQRATISSRVGPASAVAGSLTGPSVPAPGALARVDDELGRLPGGVANAQRERQLASRAEMAAGHQGSAGELRLEPLRRLLRPQRQHPAAMLDRDLRGPA